MDESMLSFYIDQAKTYVKNETVKQTEYLIVMVACIFYD
ncbi:phage gp6-like head-tail connector protein, partial [Bacillus cereus]|nr:phage gp6-like head-tail connector protein [Bacillus cereus]